MRQLIISFVIIFGILDLRTVSCVTWWARRSNLFLGVGFVLLSLLWGERVCFGWLLQQLCGAERVGGGAPGRTGFTTQGPCGPPLLRGAQRSSWAALGEAVLEHSVFVFLHPSSPFWSSSVSGDPHRTAVCPKTTCGSLRWPAFFPRRDTCFATSISHAL